MRQSDGRLSEKTRQETPLVELLPHFQERDAYARPAIEEGWKAESPGGESRVHWACPECSRRGSSS